MGNLSGFQAAWITHPSIMCFEMRRQSLTLRQRSFTIVESCREISQGKYLRGLTLASLLSRMSRSVKLPTLSMWLSVDQMSPALTLQYTLIRKGRPILQICRYRAEGIKPALLRISKRTVIGLLTSDTLFLTHVKESSLRVPRHSYGSAEDSYSHREHRPSSRNSTRPPFLKVG